MRCSDNYKIGDVVDAVVENIKDYGVFVKVNKKTQGLVHISNISSNYVNNIESYVQIGKTYKAYVIGIDEEHNRLNLSLKESMEKKIKEKGSGFDILKEKMPEWISKKKEKL